MLALAPVADVPTADGPSAIAATLMSECILTFRLPVRRAAVSALVWTIDGTASPYGQIRSNKMLDNGRYGSNT